MLDTNRALHQGIVKAPGGVLPVSGMESVFKATL
jgi:hypothetical protein